MKLFLLICLTAFAISTQASKVIWGVDFDVDSPMKVANFTGGSAYSYILSGSGELNGFLNSWDATASAKTDFGGLSSSLAGLTERQLTGLDTLSTPTLTNVTEGSGKYLVVIMVGNDGNSYYKIAENATVVSDTAGSDPSTDTNFDGTGWTKMPNQVPEPTVLALLALGIAGLVLKRKVA